MESDYVVTEEVNAELEKKGEKNKISDMENDKQSCHCE